MAQDNEGTTGDATTDETASDAASTTATPRRARTPRFRGQVRFSPKDKPPLASAPAPPPPPPTSS
jgi:hypothetical protein